MQANSLSKNTTNYKRTREGEIVSDIWEKAGRDEQEGGEVESVRLVSNGERLAADETDTDTVVASIIYRGIAC